MHDRLPPLSRYNHHFSLEPWQCQILKAALTTWGRLSLVPTPVRGNVAIFTVCMDQISFQEITGNAQVCIGTPKALDVILTKTRGAAGQELVRHEKEFTILNGSYAKFDYVVLY